jgi:hypothetical protein
VAGKKILATVACDESFPDVIANVIQSFLAECEYPHEASQMILFSQPLQQ